MWEWLASPIDASRAHDVGWHLSWHARLMVVAWGVLVPSGVFAARYLKVLPWQDWPRVLDSRAWWNTHKACQYSAFVLTWIGATIIWNAPPLSIASGPHWMLGWVILFFSVFQVAGGLLRGSKGGPTEPAPDGSLRGDHYDMTRRRLMFERLHKGFGYLALLLAVLTILSGLWQANAPVWMFAGLLAWWSGLLTFALILQRRGMVVDTYQAIWGPDPKLPGNQPQDEGLGSLDARPR